MIKKIFLAFLFLINLGATQAYASKTLDRLSNIANFISCEVSCSKETCGGSEGAWVNCFRKCKDDPNTILNCKNAAEKKGLVTACQKQILTKSKPLNSVTCQTKCTRQSCKDKGMAQNCFNGCFNAKWASIDNCVSAAIDSGNLDDCQKEFWSGNSSSATNTAAKIFKFVSCEVSCSKETCGGSEGAWINCFKKCQDNPNTILNCKNAAASKGFVTSCQEEILKKRGSLSALTCQTKCTRQSCKDSNQAADCFFGCYTVKGASIQNCVSAAIDAGHFKEGGPLKGCQGLWEMK
jgi:hypothetical protein